MKQSEVLNFWGTKSLRLVSAPSSWRWNRPEAALSCILFLSLPYSKSEITDPINTSIFQMTAMAVTVGTQIRESIRTLFFVRDLGVLVANHIFV